MISENTFNMLTGRAKEYKYSSMNYVDFDECKDADILYDRDSMILLLDKSKTPAMLYFASDNFDALLKIIADIPGQLRLHFVPREYKERLERLGFIEWGEYADCDNKDLSSTAALISDIGETEYLSVSECDETAKVSRKCKLQSRGFEGESAEWFSEWLSENKVIILRRDLRIAGYCCVSIINEGLTLWIREIAVDPDYQGTGLGKSLMEHAIKYGADNGAIKGFLMVDLLNKNAIGLYNKYDFYVDSTDSELQMIKTEE